MDAIKNLNTAMRYIEKRLLDDVIDYTKAAKLAGCSEYQFRRMFAHLANMPLNEYVRKRRLSLAVELLRTGDEKIIDIAQKCGYESSDSFSRAFHAQYGMTPYVCRKSSDLIKAFPPLFFQLSLKEGGVKMECQIIEHGELIFEGCLVKNEGGNVWFKWEETDSKGSADPKYAHYHQVDNYPDESRAFEVRFYPDSGEYVFTGTEATREEPGTAWEYLKVPAAVYAVFDIDQKIDMSPQFQGVDEWLEENKGKYRQLEWDAGGHINSSIFVINLYDHRGKYQNDRVMELWIPLVKLK